MHRIVYNKKYNKYNLGDEHPFSPIRLEMTLDLLRHFDIPIEIIAPDEATVKEVESIHDSSYVRAVEKLSLGEEVENYQKFGLGTQDNPIITGMAEGARFHVGGTLTAARMLLRDEEQKIFQFGGGLHHAQKNMASGFCIYNDLAVAIEEMKNQGWHVAYLDLDVHHGDGVQNIFNSTSEVMTISIHESGEFLYPGSGWVHETGTGMGKALKLNIPLEPFTEGESYLEAISKVVEPALAWFKPDALVVQAGADTHFSDPLADIMLTTFDFENLYREVNRISDLHCNGRALYTFGGGYSLTATPRIWAILFFVINKIQIPESIPNEWITKWEEKLKINLPKRMHDFLPAYDEIPRREEISNINKDTYQHLLDLVIGDWL